MFLHLWALVGFVKHWQDELTNNNKIGAGWKDSRFLNRLKHTTMFDPNNPTEIKVTSDDVITERPMNDDIYD